MKYFSIEELTRTNTGLDNKPNDEQQANLIFLADNLLDKARELYGKPIRVTSGFRSLAVNKKVGGSKTSQHLLGEASDIKCADMTKLFNILSHLEFDQLIWEFGDFDKQIIGLIHVSYRQGHNRKQILNTPNLKQYYNIQYDGIKNKWIKMI